MAASDSLSATSQTVTAMRTYAEAKAVAGRTDLAVVGRARRYLGATPDDTMSSVPGHPRPPASVVDMRKWYTTDAGRDAAFRALLSAIEATTLPPQTPLIEPSHIWQMPSDTPRPRA